MKNIKVEKKDIFTIPNILSYIRILLVPIFVYMYLKAETPQEYMLSAGIVLLSSLTDCFDGFIARKFHMITELGKLIDPVADKLMQAAMLLVLLIKIDWMIWIVILFLVKEGFMFLAGLFMLRKGRKLDGAKWYGKVSTAFLYVVMIVIIAIPNIDHKLMQGLMGASAVLLALSFVMYGLEYVKMYRSIK